MPGTPRMTSIGSPPIWTAPAPYVGRRPFGRPDASRFFGRGAEIRAVQAALLRSRVVVVHGPSAAGKTSLLRAGVLPALAADPSLDVLPVADLRLPGALVSPPLARNTAAYSVLRRWRRRAPLRPADATMSDFLLSLPGPSDDEGSSPDLIAAIDSFDEVFAVPAEERRAFMEELADALRRVQKLRLLIVLNDDSLERFRASLQRLGTFPVAFSRLDTLSPEAALKAITEPLAATGRSFAAGVAEDLVGQLSTLSRGGPGLSSGAPAGYVGPLLLQIVCDELWSNWPADEGLITADQLAGLADFDQAFRHFYDAVVEEVHLLAGRPESALRAWVDDAFIASDGKPKTVRNGLLVTAGAANSVVDAFVERHLLVAEHRTAGVWYKLGYPSFAAPIREVNRQWRAASRPGDLEYKSELPPPDTFTAAAQAAMGEGNLASAQRYAQKAADCYRSAGDERRLAHTLMLRGDIARAEGDIDSAEENFQAALSRFTILEDRNLTARTLSALADIRILTGDYRSAVELHQLAVDKLPTDTDALIGLGYALWYGGFPADADATFSQALIWDEGAVRAYVGRGQVRAEMREYRGALADVDHALRTDLTIDYQADALSARALALAGLGRVEEAEAALAVARASDPSRTRTYFRSARISVMHDQPQAAIEDLQRALVGWPPLSSPEETTARRMLLRLRRRYGARPAGERRT